MNTSSSATGFSRFSVRSLVTVGLAVACAWLALERPVQAQNELPKFPPAPPPANAAGVVTYIHKQVAMPIQPTLGKESRPFVPEYEEEFKGWEVVNCISLPQAPWPLDVKVPADRRYRPIPNQKITWMLYTLRRPAP
jgi:hypothetical protein